MFQQYDTADKNDADMSETVLDRMDCSHLLLLFTLLAIALAEGNNYKTFFYE
jgi:hypothetical protein